jgi:hypothetical protein
VSAFSNPPASNGRNNSPPSKPKTLLPVSLCLCSAVPLGRHLRCPLHPGCRRRAPNTTRHHLDRRWLAFLPAPNEAEVCVRPLHAGQHHPFCHLERSGPAFPRRAVSARGATERRDLSSSSAQSPPQLEGAFSRLGEIA